MSEVKPETDLPDLEGTKRLRLWPERWRWRLSLVLALVLALAAGLAWFNREQIAGDLIDDTLDQYGLEASYEVEDIGARRQVITDLVIGDPARPDFTAERVSLDISYTYGPPAIGQIELVGARLYGAYKDSAISFGSLDPLIFAESEEPSGLPALNLNIVDGRALLESDFGNIGAKLDGKGQLDDGFVGKIAATAPELGIQAAAGREGCSAQSATLYGDVSSENGQISFDGPLRIGNAACQGATIEAADIGAQMTLASDFASIEGDLALSASNLSAAGAALSTLGGSANVAWRFDGELSVRHDINGAGLGTDYANAQEVGIEGTLRSRDGFARNDWTSRVTARGVDARKLVSGDGLAKAREAAKGSFVAGLLGKFRSGIEASAQGGAFAGDVSVRSQPGSLRAVIPEARLQNSAGETLVSLSRINYASANQDEGKPNRLAGNILTGGAGLPRINARLEQADGGATIFRMTMAQFRKGEDAIAIPRLEARQDASGRIRFNGMVQAEGAIPGGNVRGFSLPVEGGWSPANGFALGSRCIDAKFAAFEAYDFALTSQILALCPIAGKAMVSYNSELKIAARVSDLSLSGQYGDSQADISLGAATLRYPGGFGVEGLAVSLGSGGEAMRFTAANFDGNISDGLDGSFAGVGAQLGALPLELSDLSGQWSFADNAVLVSEGTFSLTDRPDPASTTATITAGQSRFEPLQGRGASLRFADGKIWAQSDLVHPLSGRKLADITLNQNLGEGAGQLHLDVPGIRFDESFQPDDLTALTKGLIAFVDGEVEGEGEISWEGETITSGGTFSTNGIDFAAAFGPVRGLRGEIVFTDLLALTTRPSNFVSIESVNPGTEALDGRIEYSITNGTIIDIKDGRWPFMGGELILRPTVLDYGGGKGQNYIFEMVGLDAATFVTQMELANLGATGKFDGTIPIIFDAQGNGTIQGGLMISRPPGGNVSYVGELTYEDLGAMGNFAFQTLRSLDFRQMSIELNGNLAGEIITNFNIDGVRQGVGADQNYVTRQLAKLPIRFKVNVRSENFYTLATIVRGIFDPTVFASAAEVERFVGDNIGALQSQQAGEGVPSPAPNPAPSPEPDPVTSNDEMQRRSEPPVQPPESEDLQ